MSLQATIISTGTSPSMPTAQSRSAAPLVAILRRIGQAVLDANMRRAEREMARYLERSGGRLTDDIERQMFCSLLRCNFRP